MFAAQFLTTLNKLVKEALNRKALIPLVTVLLVFGLEQILVTKTFYQCPEVGYRLYGGLFLFGPGACFFVLALVLNNSFWDSVTGCYRGNFDRKHVYRKTLKALVKSCLIGLVWLVLAFANAQFYVCFRLGPMPSQDVLKNMEKDQREKMQKNFNEIKSRSTIIAWLLFLSVVLLSLLFIVVRRCCLWEDKESLPSLRKYEKLEAKAAVAKFKEKMKILAKREGEKQVEMHFEDKNEKDAYSIVRKTRLWLARKYLGGKDSFPDGYLLNEEFHLEEIDAKTKE